MKKIYNILMILFLLAAAIFATLILADHNEEKPVNAENTPANTITETTVTTTGATTMSEPISLPQSYNIGNGVICDVTSSKVLWEKCPEQRIYPASLTKLLTAYTALKYVSPETVFTVGSELKLLNPRSSLCLIQKGHRLTLYDLLCGMLMASGNDAAYTIAVNTARAVGNNEMTDREALQFFYSLMNQSAREIGMSDSHFCSPDGFDTSEQYTTVNDLLKLSLRVYENQTIMNIVEQPQRYVVFESGQNITWKNTNLLLDSKSIYYTPYATGLKTGTSANAGKCLIASAEKNGKNFLVIVMNCKTDHDRYGFIRQILNKVA